MSVSYELMCVNQKSAAAVSRRAPIIRSLKGSVLNSRKLDRTLDEYVRPLCSEHNTQSLSARVTVSSHAHLRKPLSLLWLHVAGEK